MSIVVSTGANAIASAALSTGATAAIFTSTAAMSVIVSTGANVAASVALSTGADAAATAAIGGGACIVESDLSEFDSLSCQTQMIVLMDTNASGASNESSTASNVKSIFDAVMRQRDAIIAEVIAVKPELKILITYALDGPFNVQNRQRPGKIIAWRS